MLPSGQRPMAVLPHDKIRTLHRAIVEARLTGNRTALLGGIDAAFVDSLPTASDPSGQIFSDLHTLNATEQLGDGSVPLGLWLDNALSLAGQRVEAEVIREIQELARGGGGARAPTTVLTPRSARPMPLYPDDATRALCERIDAARARKRRLEEVGVDTAEIEREIRDLRRQLREGGQLRAGDALGGGSYLLLNQVGRGGFAIVWEAYDRERGERVAVKVLHANLAGDRIRLERFSRGARIMADLVHEAIVGVLEPYAEEGGFHYFVMELLPGGDLRRAVLDQRLAGEALIDAILRVGDALAGAHRKGLVHRDIKPANILLDASGAPLLTDFDLIGGADTTGGTRTGAIGSWIYAAPELLHRPQDADARADVYGLGMTAIFGLHGAELPMDVLRGADSIIAGLPCNTATKAALRRAVDWDPKARFTDAAELCAALRLARETAEPEPPPPELPPPPEPPPPARAPIDLAGQDLRSKNLAHADLRGADLRRVDLSGAMLSGADLAGARLTDAKLVRADLRGASLVEADLCGVDLSFGRLEGADLRGAALDGACFDAASLVGAKVDGLAGCRTLGAALPQPEDIMPMVASASACRALVFRPDGALLATAHDSGAVYVWDAVTGAAIRALKGHTARVRCLAVSLDGQTLATGSTDMTVRIWQIATGRCIGLLKGHSGPVRGVAISPDGQTLISAGDTAVRRWLITGGSTTHVFKEHTAPLWSAAMSPDGQVVACGAGDGSIALWQTSTGKLLSTWRAQPTPVLGLAWSPDGQLLASAGDVTIRLWRSSSGQAVRTLKGHSAMVRSVAWSPDGQILVSGADDCTLRLWRATTGELQQVIEGHTRAVTSVAISPDGQTLAAGAVDRPLTLWQMSTGRARHRSRARPALVQSVTVSPDGQTLAVGADDWTVTLWTISTGQALRVLKGHRASVRSLSFCPDGQTLAVGADDGTITLWQPSTGQSLRILKGHSSAVQSLSFCPDGQTLASGGDDRNLLLWQLSSGQRLGTLGHSGAVRSVAWSPDGQTLASAGDDWSLLLWQPSRGKSQPVQSTHETPVRSPDGQTFASGAGALYPRIETLRPDGRLQRTLSGSSGAGQSLAWSPDGQTLASGGVDAQVRLWSPSTGNTRMVLRGRAAAHGLAFSPDGSVVYAGAEDGSFTAWETARGEVLRSSSGLTTPTVCASFSSDCRVLAGATHDGAVELWDTMTGSCYARLVKLPDGWVAFTPDGRYKFEGRLDGAFWHAISLRRFEPGELDRHLPAPLRLPHDAPLSPQPGP
jgi:WD40 repeat protein/serine/threonine protein kinase